MTDPYVVQPASSPTDPSVATATEGATEVSVPESGSSADVVKSQGRMVADDAAEGGKQVARVAADEAATVADEAKNQARSLWEQASSQLSIQAADQKGTLASWLRGLAEELPLDGGCLAARSRGVRVTVGGDAGFRHWAGRSGCELRPECRVLAG